MKIFVKRLILREKKPNYDGQQIINTSALLYKRKKNYN